MGLCFERDKEITMQQELDDKLEYLLGVKRIFDELDEDGNGKVELRELMERTQNPQVAALFSSLGLDTDVVDKLFVLVDRDCSGYVTKEEFMWGCSRLRGQAKSLDLEILHQDLRYAIEKLLEIQDTTKYLQETHHVGHGIQDLQRPPLD